jgi:hypothetical protein
MRRNLIPPQAFPYQTAAGALLDSGDYPAALDKLAGEPCRWMRGESERGWCADFDFLLSPQHLTRLVEGGYDRKVANGHDGPANTLFDRGPQSPAPVYSYPDRGEVDEPLRDVDD